MPSRISELQILIQPSENVHPLRINIPLLLTLSVPLSARVPKLERSEHRWIWNNRKRC